MVTTPGESKSDQQENAQSAATSDGVITCEHNTSDARFAYRKQTVSTTVHIPSGDMEYRIPETGVVVTIDESEWVCREREFWPQGTEFKNGYPEEFPVGRQSADASD